jgi:hypothetical protein
VMDRSLVLRLETSGMEAEAAMNGVSLLRVRPAQRVALLAVHEYALVGSNQLTLVIRPVPSTGSTPAWPAEWSDGASWVRLQLLLPRTGAAVHPDLARTVGQVAWSPAAGEVMTFPVQMEDRVDLPIAFPRWRWLDMPVITSPGHDGADTSQPALQSLRPALAAWLQEIALGLARGDVGPLLQACRLRLEEQAIAYQQPIDALVQRFAEHIRALHSAEPLKPILHTADTLKLRSVANGRLIECLGLDDEPALRAPRLSSQGAQAWVAWPLRVAMIERRFYGLR